MAFVPVFFFFFFCDILRANFCVLSSKSLSFLMSHIVSYGVLLCLIVPNDVSWCLIVSHGVLRCLMVSHGIALETSFLTQGLHC